jgi:hypothetical protein
MKLAVEGDVKAKISHKHEVYRVMFKVMKPKKEDLHGE